jgi:acyl-CoA dehydrogenase
LLEALQQRQQALAKPTAKRRSSQSENASVN